MKASGLGGRILVLLSIGFVALIVSGVISLWAVEKGEEQAERLRHTYEVRATANRLIIGATQAESGQRGFLLTGQERHATIEAEGRADALHGAARLRELISDNPQQVARMDRLMPILEERLQLLDQRLRTTSGFECVDRVRTVRSHRAEHWYLPTEFVEDREDVHVHASFDCSCLQMLDAIDRPADRQHRCRSVAE